MSYESLKVNVKMQINNHLNCITHKDNIALSGCFMGCSFKIDHFKHISPEFIMRDLLSLETLRSSLDLKVLRV